MPKSWGGLSNHSIFERIVSLENLFIAWREFSCGKWDKGDINEFALHVEDSLFLLHEELVAGRYRHGRYTPFYITDPKVRHIHKAQVRDRVLHHAIFRILNPIFDPSFVFDSYSCRGEKGTHRAVTRLGDFLRKQSRNNTRNVYVLKCDVRKFFDSIDHRMLLDTIYGKVKDRETMDLLCLIVSSFCTAQGKGIPLGNVTSQLFANIYLNELDQFAKHILRAQYYIRYCDDFVILSHDREWLVDLIDRLRGFLQEKLSLELHPHKISIRTWRQGIDFLGYVSFPRYTAMRLVTKKRMMATIAERIFLYERGFIGKRRLQSTVQSYLGMLEHCDGYALQGEIRGMVKRFKL